MAKKKKEKDSLLSKRTRDAIFAVVFFVVAIILILAYIDAAGIAGQYMYELFSYLLGAGYILLPTLSAIMGLSFIQEHDPDLELPRVISAVVFLLASLGMLELFMPEHAGVFGGLIASPLVAMLDIYATGVLLIALALISVMVIFETQFSFASLKRLTGIALFSATTQKAGAKAETGSDTITITDNTTPIDENDAEADMSEDETEDHGDDELNVSHMSADTDTDETESEMTEILNAPHGKEYTPPPLSLLQKDTGKPGVGDVKANANIIKRTLQNFNIDVEMDEISIGPTVTRYALKPAEGVRLSKITNLQNNLELALAAHPVRIEAPIPGKALVGIEVPNNKKTTVGLGALLASKEFQQSSNPLEVGLGKGISGESYFTDINDMPHMLIAGATGSGKSVTMHSLITSLLYRNSPENMKLIMVDPKRVELTLYNGTPHLLTPVITQAKKSILALKWAAREMDRRYDILEQNSVRDISSYHENVLNPALEKHSKKTDDDEVEDDLPDKMPYIVIFIDELADIMQAYPRELESAIVRLAQMSRAVGIHLIISTQRPSVNVITGLIKANVPARIALQVSSQVDSRTILDSKGAEQLLGAGDMLYMSGDMSKPVRIQSAFISEKEVKSVVKHLKDQYKGELNTQVDISGENEKKKAFEAQLEDIEEDEERDEKYEDALKTIVHAGKASTSYLQRKLRIGYSRAARIMDTLEENGIISEKDGTKPRDVLISEEEAEKLLGESFRSSPDEADEDTHTAEASEDETESSPEHR